MSITIKPSNPFSNGMSYEFFLECFCYRCKNHKTDKDGFCAFVTDGGCPIENAMEDARFGSDFPSDDIVQIERDGKPFCWNACKQFETDDTEVMEKYKSLFEDSEPPKGE